mmetsp:Transcript_31465/g.54555  ORF Transcript_31465/g.54555 Transcript_31465/m.54555 type:complete len:384 (-) Transcript_31465:4815-5966(-)
MKPVYLDYSPELSPKSRHNLLKGDGTVFTRLSKVSAKTHCNTQSPVLSMKASPGRRSSTEQMSHIKTLMAKHMKSLDKIEKERLRLEEEQMKEMKEKPEISQETKTIAEKMLEKNLEDHAKAELIATRHQKSKSEVIQLEVVKDQRPLSPDQIEAAKICQQLVHTFTNRSPEMVTTPICKVNIITGSASPLELPKSEAKTEMYGKIADLKSIRQLLAKSFNFDPIEPPDPLEMDFMSRGKYWLEQKHKKLQEKTVKLKEHQFDECTFKPNISRLKSNSISVTSTNSTNNSPRYANIHSPHQLSSRRLSLKKDLLESTIKSEANSHDLKSSRSAQLESMRQAFKPVYSSLSPVQIKCTYNSGFNINRFRKTTKSAKRGVNLRLK